MPERKQEKLLCVEALRHSEYYDMQGIFDELYEKSLAGEEFTDLMGLILSRENMTFTSTIRKTAIPPEAKVAMPNSGKLTGRVSTSTAISRLAGN